MHTPDIVFIHCHDLGRRLSIYDETRTATPGLERIASEGIVFDRFFSTSTLCTPARGSILTGRYPHEIGLFGLTNRGWDLDRDAKGIPHYLNEAGYRTVLVGMQHEACDLNQLGYSERIPMPSRHPAPVWNVARQAADLIAALPARGERAPLYLNVGIFEPHRHNYWDRYEPEDPAQVTVPAHLPDTPGVREDLAAYDGLIRAMDEGVQIVLGALDDAGLADDTLVLFTTDHGIAFPGAKVNCYDPGIGVAAMARWPERIAAGSRSDALLSHIDWLPTVLDCVGGEAGAEVRGRSFLPLMRGESYERGEHVFAEATYHGWQYDPVRCVRSATHKLIVNFDSCPARYMGIDDNPHNGIRAIEDYDSTYVEPRPRFELFDLENDPAERENRAEDEACSGILAELLDRLHERMRATGDPVERMYRTNRMIAAEKQDPNPSGRSSGA